MLHTSLLVLNYAIELCLSFALEQDRSTPAALMDCHQHHHHSHTHSLKVRAVASGKKYSNEEHDAHKHIQPLHGHAQASVQLPDAAVLPQHQIFQREEGASHALSRGGGCKSHKHLPGFWHPHNLQTHTHTHMWLKSLCQIAQLI